MGFESVEGMIGLHQSGKLLERLKYFMNHCHCCLIETYQRFFARECALALFGIVWPCLTHVWPPTSRTFCPKIAIFPQFQIYSIITQAKQMINLLLL